MSIHRRLLGFDLLEENQLLSKVAQIAAGAGGYTVDWRTQDMYVTVRFAKEMIITGFLRELASLAGAELEIDDVNKVIIFRDRAGVDN